MKTSFFVLSSMLFFLISCKEQNSACGSECPDVDVAVNEHIGFWFQDKDSIDHKLIEVADVLWRFGRFDSTDINDFDNLLVWQQECERALVHCIDSIHPGLPLPSFEKADTMVNLLENFLLDDSDLSTMGILISEDTRGCFYRYKEVSLGKKIIEEYPEFENEIRAYNSFYSKISEHLTLMTGLWGGTRSISQRVLNIIQLREARIIDLQNINNYVHSNVEYVNSIFLNVAHDLFVQSMEIAKNQCKLDSTEESWFSEYEIERIKKDIDEINKNQDCIIELFEKWYATRLEVKLEQRNPYESAMYYSCTAELILQLSKVLAAAIDY